MFIRLLLVLPTLFLLSGCFSNENFYHGLKHSQKMKEERYPKESGLVPQDKKDQTYKEYVEDIEKSKF